MKTEEKNNMTAVLRLASFAVLFAGALFFAASAAWADEPPEMQSEGVVAMTIDGEIVSFETPSGLSDEDFAASIAEREDIVTSQANYVIALFPDEDEGGGPLDDATEARATVGDHDEGGEAAFGGAGAYGGEVPALPGLESYPGLRPKSFDGPLRDGIALLALARANDPFAQIDDPTVTRNQYWLYNAGLAEAFDAGYETSGAVVIATLDSGAQLNHEDLSANLLLDYAWDAVREAPLTIDDYTNGDENAGSGHGTHVAGIAAAATNNELGVAGASYNAAIVPVNVTSGGGTSIMTADLAKGYAHLLDLVESGDLPGLRVVNISVGGYRSNDDSPLLKEIIHRARYQYDIVTVCAGGNGNPDTLAPYTANILPGDYVDCVSVTALNSDGSDWPRSDYNRCKDISAPGQLILSTYLDAARTDSYGTKTGTSMASPLVAGSLALIFAAHPEATVYQATLALYETADPIADQSSERAALTGSAGAIDVAAALELLAQPDALDVGFYDVPGTAKSGSSEPAWYTEAIVWAAARGLVSGYSDPATGEPIGYYGPDDLITREQIAQIIYNLLGDGEIAPADTAHADVDQAAWYAKAVNWCAAKGFMTGYSGTDRFGIGDFLTREQLVRVIHNAGTDSASSKTSTIVDGGRIYRLPDYESVSVWAFDDMTWAVGNSVLNGVEVEPGMRYLFPGATTTRAEVAQVLENSLSTGYL